MGLNDGSTSAPPPLTVLIGPNNAGKSRFLKDVLSLTTPHEPPSVIVKEIEVSLPTSLQELRESYDVERYVDQNGVLRRSLSPSLLDEIKRSSDTWPGEYPTLFTPRYVKRAQMSNLIGEYGYDLVAFMSTEDRLALVKENDSASHERECSNILQALYNADPGTEQEIRRITLGALNLDLALDYVTALRRIQFRVAPDFNSLPQNPRLARGPMLQCERLDDQGDGVRAFVGLVTALITIRRPLWLIDEPEAFLHPPQAWRIGQIIAEQSTKDRQLIVATHSTDVLQGILSKQSCIDLIRIEREDSKNRFRHLESARVQVLVTDPLLSAARVLDGAFYVGAVVVEADSDVKFYQSAVRRLSPEADLHFVCADNKQTVAKVIEAYSDLGVRSLGIVDFDILRERSEFERLLKALDLQPGDLDLVMRIRDELQSEIETCEPDERLANVARDLQAVLSKLEAAQRMPFELETAARAAKEATLAQVAADLGRVRAATSAWKDYKERGRGALSATCQKRFDELFAKCLLGGLLINPFGELESSLTEFGVKYSTNKADWIVRALTLIPSLDPTEPRSFWTLIGQINAHFNPPTKATVSSR